MEEMTRSCAENTSDFSVTVLLQVSAANLQYSTDGNFMFQENQTKPPPPPRTNGTHTHFQNARVPLRCEIKHLDCNLKHNDSTMFRNMF